MCMRSVGSVTTQRYHKQLTVEAAQEAAALLGVTRGESSEVSHHRRVTTALSPASSQEFEATCMQERVDDLTGLTWSVARAVNY